MYLTEMIKIEQVNDDGTAEVREMMEERLDTTMEKLEKHFYQLYDRIELREKLSKKCSQNIDLIKQRIAKFDQLSRAVHLKRMQASDQSDSLHLEWDYYI